MFPFLLAALLAVSPGTEEHCVVVEALVEALAQSDVEKANQLFVVEGTGRARQRLIEHIETYDCVSIRSRNIRIVRAEDDAVRYELELDATAATSGSRTAVDYPRRWAVTVQRVDGQWRLKRAVTLERAVAIGLARDEELTEEKVGAAATGLDFERMLRDLCDEVLETPSEHQRQSAMVVESVARKRGLILAEIAAVRARAILELGEGKFDAAEVFLDQASSLALESGLPDAIGMTLLTAGANAWLRGDRTAAVSRYETAERTLDQAGDARSAMKAFYMHARMLGREGNISEALALSSRLAHAAERFNWIEGRCIVSLLRAEIYEHIHETAIAREHSINALRYARVLRDTTLIAAATQNMAIIERAAGNPQAAVTLLSEHLQQLQQASVKRSVPAVMRLELAAALNDLERFDDAENELIRTVDASRGAFERGVEAMGLSALARVRLRAGRFEDALRVAQEADAIARGRIGSVAVGAQGVDEWSVRGTLGIALAAAGQRDAAIAALRSAVGIIETRREKLGVDEVALSGFLQGKDEPYRVLVRLLIGAGRDREALLVSERLRARGLGTAIAQGNIDVLPAMTAEESARVDAMNADIAAINKQMLVSESGEPDLRTRLDETRVALRALLTDLYARSPAVHARSSEDPEAIVGDPARLLPQSDQALLTFLVDDEQTFAFFIHRDADELKIVSRRIAVSRSELTRTAQRLTTAVASRSLSFRDDARRLHELLLSPFLPDIRSKRLLYIVPDGVLWRVPFHALQAGNGEYLIEQVAVAYTPSLTLLRARRPKNDRARGTALFAVADPVLPPGRAMQREAMFRDNNFGPLPDSRSEVREIARLYGGRGGSRVLIGNDATEAVVKREAEAFNVLHIATHGVINDAAPMYSAVLLSSSGADDGLLEAREMIDMRLGADLAILSACQSAGSSVTPGEGLIGMSWALMVAGCRNTVVSQWNVASRSTAQLMIAFHREMIGHDYATALQRAQLAILRTKAHRHPFYWSAFVLLATSQE